jgi:hypothetical protein
VRGDVHQPGDAEPVDQCGIVTRSVTSAGSRTGDGSSAHPTFDGRMLPMDPPRVLTRHTAMRCLGVLAAGALFVLNGCSGPSDDVQVSSGPPDPSASSRAAHALDSGAAAVWTLRSSTQVGFGHHHFTAMVRRLGCNNGVTGTVQAPDVELRDDSVVVTFGVTPEHKTENCLGNDGVPYEVSLPEPLRHRSLVDGQCKSEASGTSFCRQGGIRYNAK